MMFQNYYNDIVMSICGVIFDFPEFIRFGVNWLTKFDYLFLLRKTKKEVYYFSDITFDPFQFEAEIFILIKNDTDIRKPI